MGKLLVLRTTQSSVTACTLHTTLVATCLQTTSRPYRSRRNLRGYESRSQRMAGKQRGRSKERRSCGRNPCSPPRREKDRKRFEPRTSRKHRSKKRLPHQENPFGSSAATDGHTISVTTALTTFSQAAKTSTSSFSTPKCTPTPADKHPSPLLPAQSQNLRQPANAPRRKTLLFSQWTTATFTSHKFLWART